MRSRAAAIALVVLVVLVAAAMHTRESGERAIDESHAAEARGDFFTAVLRARDAAECAPFASSDEGFTELERLAQAAEARGDEATAVLAWRAMRAAALASVSVTRSGAARREEAEGAIARIGGRTKSGPDARVTEASLVDAMAKERTPTAARDLALFAGAAMFLAGAVIFARDRRTGGARGRAAAAAIGAFIGAALCAIGLFL